MAGDRSSRPDTGQDLKFERKLSRGPQPWVLLVPDAAGVGRHRLAEWLADACPVGTTPMWTVHTAYWKVQDSKGTWRVWATRGRVGRDGSLPFSGLPVECEDLRWTAYTASRRCSKGQQCPLYRQHHEPSTGLIGGIAGAGHCPRAVLEPGDWRRLGTARKDGWLWYA